MKTLIGLPTYDGRAQVTTVLAAILQCGKSDHCFAYSQDSALTRGFNRLWIQALALRGEGVTHFAMLHDDVVPEAGWLDRLHNVMSEHKADIVSAISPIKDGRGLTSTGIWEPSRSHAVSRFTMHQLESMPKTFSSARLVVNTGCMLVDLRWKYAPSMRFHVEDVIQGDDAICLTEDYLFSIEAEELGAKIVATREVKLEHVGKAAYPNYGAWGFMKVDTRPAILRPKLGE